MTHTHTPGDLYVDAKPGLPIYIYAKQPIPGSIPPLRIEVATITCLEDGIDNEARRAEAKANADRIVRAVNNYDALLTALESIGDAMAFSARDWSQNHRDAWVYGIVHGWGDALDEVAAMHRWDSEAVSRLQAMHAAIAAAKGDTRCTR